MNSEPKRGSKQSKIFNLGKIEDSCNSIVDNVPIGVFRLRSTPDSKIIEVNTTLAKMFGFDTIEELINFPVTQLYSDYDKYKQTCEISGGGIIYDQEFKLKKRDGSPIYASSSLNIRRKENEIEWIDGVIKDITQKKKLENELLEYKRRYQALFHSSNDAVFLLDLEGVCIEVNQKACDLLDYSQEELIGMSYEKVVVPQGYDNRAIKRKLIAEKEVRLPLYQRYLWKNDGSKIPVELSLTLVRDADGNPQNLQCIVRDITKRKQEELARQELELQRKKFIETTTHELRTPLTIFQGYIELLDRRGNDLSEDQRKKSLSTIKKNIFRLNRLIDEVSDVSKIERDSFDLEPEITNLEPYIEEIFSSHQRLLGDQINFHFNCKSSPIFINIDRFRFHQAFDNIIDNAVKHTCETQRSIKIEITTPFPHKIRISVNDNGAGIDPNDLERIFEPFVSIKTKYSPLGSGIGLYLTRSIIERLGGTIKALSKGKDQGSTFIIDLPMLYDENL